jgi:hypothetical protein
MRILLDTHIFLWFISGDLQLSVDFRDSIQDSDNEVYLSVVSAWEILGKYQLGKLFVVNAHPTQTKCSFQFCWRGLKIGTISLVSGSIPATKLYRLSLQRRQARARLLRSSEPLKDFGVR